MVIWKQLRADDDDEKLRTQTIECIGGRRW